ncbi:MAG: response regulator [Chloroflexi bacterium]|nr:response regulator [Chloroflexota bacterium]
MVIADDEPLVRKGLRAVLESQGGLAELVGEASSGHDVVSLVTQLKPDLVLLDIRMPGGDGISAAERIRSISPYTRIIVLTAYPDFTYAQKMLRLGASDYLLKPSSPDSIREAIGRIAREVESGEASFASVHGHRLAGELAAVSPGRPEEPGTDKLRPRGVVASAKKYIGDNFHRRLPLGEVADAVGLSPWYFSSIFKKAEGDSFRHYLTQVRVEAGKRALLETDLLVQVIAEGVGFSEPSHFTQAFKRVVGVTPRQFQRRERRDG